MILLAATALKAALTNIMGWRICVRTGIAWRCLRDHGSLQCGDGLPSFHGMVGGQPLLLRIIVPSPNKSMGSIFLSPRFILPVTCFNRSRSFFPALGFSHIACGNSFYGSG